jgi:hypothetical protein
MLILILQYANNEYFTYFKIRLEKLSDKNEAQRYG